MATTPAECDTASVTLSPSLIGRAFAVQYYTILHQMPEIIHRFYCKYDHPDADEIMSNSSPLEGILSHGPLKAELKSVDAQESCNDGVIVLVTGIMTKEDESRQPFIQTFFLAPQDGGFFVLNDIFRFVDDDNKNEGFRDGETASGKAQNHGNVDQPEEVTEGEVYYDPSEDGEGAVMEQEGPVAKVHDIPKQFQPVAEVYDISKQSEAEFHDVPKQSEPVVDPKAKTKGRPQKSYASVVKVIQQVGSELCPSLPWSLIFPWWCRC